MSKKANFALAQCYAAMEAILRATSMSMIALESNRACGNRMSCSEHNEKMENLSNALARAIENLGLIEVTNEWAAENCPEYAQMVESVCEQARRACSIAMSTAVHFGCVHLEGEEHTIPQSERAKLRVGYEKLVAKLRSMEHSDKFQDSMERKICGSALDVISFDMQSNGTLPEPHQMDFDHEVYDLVKLRARSYMRKTVLNMLKNYDGTGPLSF